MRVFSVKCFYTCPCVYTLSVAIKNMLNEARITNQTITIAFKLLYMLIGMALYRNKVHHEFLPK